MTDPHDTPPQVRPLPRILGTDRSDEHAGETVFSNGHGGTAQLSICVPAYKDDASQLINALSQLDGADQCTLIVFDDGTGDSVLTENLISAVSGFSGPARLETSKRNLGRSHARNRLVARAEADWLLLLDADMLPDDDQFLRRYLNALTAAEDPALIAGGFTLKQAKASANQHLHFAQAAASDCLTAAERSKAPGRYVFTSNILVHRQVLEQIGFDEGFSGWGWEDVDWGLRVADHFPILHIDNTATHLGLEQDAVLVDKFGSSGANFARLVEKHPVAAESMALLKAARNVKGIPLIKPVARAISLQRIWPTPVRLAALKVFRAAAYSEYLPKDA